MWPVLLGLFVDRKARQFDQFVPGLEGSTAVRLVCLESFGQQLQQVYLSSLVGFESHVCQLHEIDVQVAKGGFGCEFVWLFLGVSFTPLPGLMVAFLPFGVLPSAISIAYK